MRPVRVAALALACASSVGAQERSSTSGIPQPIQSFALTDDATALAGNPAGLGFSRGLLLEYAGQRGFDQGMRRADLVRLITEAGREPFERDTMYRAVTRSEDTFTVAV